MSTAVYCLSLVIIALIGLICIAMSSQTRFDTKFKPDYRLIFGVFSAITAIAVFASITRTL